MVSLKSLPKGPDSSLRSVIENGTGRVSNVGDASATSGGVKNAPRCPFFGTLTAGCRADIWTQSDHTTR